MIKITAGLVILASLSLSLQGKRSVRNFPDNGFVSSRTTFDIAPSKVGFSTNDDKTKYTKWVVDGKNWYFEKANAKNKMWVFKQDNTVVNQLEEVSSNGANVLLYEKKSSVYYRLMKDVVLAGLNPDNLKERVFNGKWEEQKQRTLNEFDDKIRWQFEDFPRTFLVKISESEWVVSEDGIETDWLDEISLLRDEKNDLVAILLDLDGNYYKLTENIIFVGRSKEDISNPRGKGHWIMPVQVKITESPKTQQVLRWEFENIKGWYFQNRGQIWILNMDGSEVRLSEISIQQNEKGHVVVLKVESDNHYFRLTEGQLFEGDSPIVQTIPTSTGYWVKLNQVKSWDKNRWIPH